MRFGYFSVFFYGIFFPAEDKRASVTRAENRDLIAVYLHIDIAAGKRNAPLDAGKTRC